MRKITLISVLLLLLACQKTTKEKAQMNEDTLYRPLIHFTPKAHWMNDPNGMFYFNGKYHLYFQYYPGASVWGPMHWGHASSEDLIHWEEHPIALYPDEMGYIFSGSAVVDHKNTSGFGKDGKTPIVAIFTHHDMDKEIAEKIDVETQSIAFSLDEGMTWTKYKGNPVIENPAIRDFRDPKVFWDDEREQWVLILAAQQKVMLYTSPNLKDWTYTADFGETVGHHGGVWECPDLFPLPVNQEKEQKWVMLVSINPGGPNGGSATQYFIGDFDGKRFSLDPEFAAQIDNDNNYWIDFGRDNYAGVTWQNKTLDNGNKLFIGWMSNWQYAKVVPTEKWRSAMTVARELSLKHNEKGYRLFSNIITPINEIAGKETQLETQNLSAEHKTIYENPAGLGALKLSFELNLEKEQSFEFQFKNDDGNHLDIGLDSTNNYFYIDRTASGAVDFEKEFGTRVSIAPRLGNEKVLTGELIIDKTSVEVFWDGGRTVMTDIFFPTAPYTQITVKGDNEIQFKQGRVTQLK